MRKCMGLVVSAVVLLGCMVGALNSSRTPTDVHVTPPAPKLTPRLAEFSGVWESIDGRPRKIVVENIHETSAVIVHSRADQPAGERNGWQERLPAYVLRDGTIRWGYPERFTLRLTEAGAVLEREGGARTDSSEESPDPCSAGYRRADIGKPSRWPPTAREGCEVKRICQETWT